MTLDIRTRPVTVQVGPHLFTKAIYDIEGDVLYLENTDPAAAVDWDETPEGDGVSYDPSGTIIQLTILSAKWRLEHDGEIKLTLPARQEHLNLTADHARQLLAV